MKLAYVIYFWSQFSVHQERTFLYSGSILSVCTPFAKSIKLYRGRKPSLSKESYARQQSLTILEPGRIRSFICFSRLSFVLFFTGVMKKFYLSSHYTPSNTQMATITPLLLCSLFANFASSISTILEYPIIVFLFSLM